MEEEELNALDDMAFFKLFLDATKSTYHEYCQFKAQEEGLTNFGEPTFEAAMEQFNRRLENIKS